MIPRLLRERPFRLFWTAQAVSQLGDQVSMIALPLAAVLALDAGPAQMGYLSAAALAPGLLFSLHFGAAVDRRGRRRATMVAADLGRAALLGSVPLAAAFGALTFAQLYVVAFGTGTLSVLFYVSYSTLFTALVPRSRYVEANQLVHGSRAFSFVAGPSLGGLLVQLFTAPFALLADAVSFLLSALCLRSLEAVEPETETAEKGHLVAGLRFIRATPALLASLLSTAWVNFFNFVFMSIFVLYATRELHVRPGTLGLVLGVGAVGGIVGAVTTGRIARRIGIGPAFVLGSFGFAAPFLLVPAAGGARWTVLGMLGLAEFGAGFGVMMLDIAVGSIQQSLVPDRLRARFSGAYMVVNYGVRPLGALAGGWLGRDDRPARDALAGCDRRGRERALPAPLARAADARAARAGRSVSADPLARFRSWWADGGPVPMALATATPDGRPSLRLVLLKEVGPDGFSFFSNYESRKGRELAANPRAALLFAWEGRQARVEGRVERLPAAESDAYWATRPAASRRSAAASRQSEPIGSREELEAAVAALPEEPPRPGRWGGYRLVPDAWEFWLHRDDRLHDRFAYLPSDGGWRLVRLQP